GDHVIEVEGPAVDRTHGDRRGIPVPRYSSGAHSFEQTLRKLPSRNGLAVPRKRAAGAVPEPPWSYAPSEVAAWMASTAGARRRGSSSRRQVRVKGFVGECPMSAEQRLVRRLAGLGFEPAESPLRFPGLFARLPRAADTRSFQGNLGGTQVHLHLRKNTVLELRAPFLPRLSFHPQSKFISQLVCPGSEGTWT